MIKPKRRTGSLIPPQLKIRVILLLSGINYDKSDVPVEVDSLFIRFEHPHSFPFSYSGSSMKLYGYQRKL